ncbi:hypothetical protein [uncultured Acetobacteroides sp.]|uniref:hypothetical protein n=1 Tax=uncultured Acetobacteroides sp. TaxID=1760811 RepID=UPI0029F4A20A|nr:hypothetical protein [uncultured Acetobacteroides sp.]
MSKQQNFDELFESAMRQDPGYRLPKSFLQGVNDRIARKLAFQIQLKVLGRTAIVLTLLTVAVFVGNYVINTFFPKYAEFTISGYVAAVVAFLILFLLFMDRVVLGYLENRQQNHSGM